MFSISLKMIDMLSNRKENKFTQLYTYMIMYLYL